MKSLPSPPDHGDAPIGTAGTLRAGPAEATAAAHPPALRFTDPESGLGITLLPDGTVREDPGSGLAFLREPRTGRFAVWPDKGPSTRGRPRDDSDIEAAIRAVNEAGNKPTPTLVGRMLYPHSPNPYRSLYDRLDGRDRRRFRQVFDEIVRRALA
jgi:hypothetical protein